MFKKTLLAVSLAAVAIASIPAQAQNANRSVVPDRPIINSPVPDNPRWFGCAATRVHGQFNVRICANGTYRVVGGGIFCRGNLRHSTWGNGLRVNLFRTSCGNGTAWSGGTFSCRFNGGSLRGYRCTHRVTREAYSYGWRNERVRFF